MSGPWDLLRSARELELPPPPPVLTATDRAVLLAIVLRVGRDATSWPSIATIAREAWAHPRSARRSVARLVAAGLLVVDRSPGGRTSNRYAVRIPTPSTPDTTPPLPGQVATAARTPCPGTPDTTPPEVDHTSDHRSDHGSAGAVAPLALTPTPTPTKSKHERRKPETAVPATDEELSAWRERWSLPDDAEVLAMVEHARTHDRRCRDWSAAFRTWKRKASQFATKPKGFVQVAPTAGPPAWEVSSS